MTTTQTTTTKAPRTSAVRDAQGRESYIGDGCTNQQGPQKLMRCNKCGADVVWITRKSTGRFVLVNVCRGQASRYYRSDLVHKCGAPVVVPTEADLAAAEAAKVEQARQDTMDMVERSLAGLDKPIPTRRNADGDLEIFGGQATPQGAHWSMPYPR